ncbi:type II secretion system secretin GspD [Tritonibacter sp. SIMBA_163]
MRFSTLHTVILLLGVIGCTETVTTSSGIFGDDVTVEHGRLFNADRAGVPTSGNAVRPGALSRGNDQFVNPRRAARPSTSQAIVVPTDNKMVELSLVNASIPAAAQAVLGDALDKRFVVSDAVQGTVTIQSTGPIPQSALLELFEAALSANGARLEKDGQVIKIVPGASGNRSFRLASEGVGTGANIIVARMEYIAASQMVNLLDPLIIEGLTAIADKRRNLVMLTGEPEQLEAALDAMNLFDVDVLSGKSIAIAELNSADPETIVDELKLIFESEEGGSLNGVIEFVPNKRLGSVLIITSRARYLAKSQKWIRELDRTASGANRYIATYELQNRSAAEVAPILNQLLSEGTTSGGDGVESPSPTQTSRVAADPSRSALLVRANRSEHREIRGLINSLDSSPKQVMLEATIAEVTLNDELSLGVRWFFENGNFDFTFSDSSSGSTGSSYPGFSTVFGAGGGAAAINALAGVTDVKIISSPTLMVLDNQEAILQIGDEVPVATQSSTDSGSTDAPTITTIEYRDTGVILSVKPNINRNGRVILDVTQEISSVAETKTSGIDSPTIRQRKIATNVLLTDGSTLALGGLVQERDTKTVTKVPGLGDTPVVGALFRRTESNKSRSELLVLIRPRVVETVEQGRSVTGYWRSKLSGANSILETGLGSPKHTVQDVFR